MTLATMRPKGQITIPAHILQEWNLQPYEKVEIIFQNGVVTLIPMRRKDSGKQKSIMDFVGVGHGCWGETSQEVENTITELRDTWTR
jgi:bifunctional DNA-binding transcriptional regulator/antitoxin component of YhaV-PrlF toxin-antitoxin module